LLCVLLNRVHSCFRQSLLHCDMSVITSIDHQYNEIWGGRRDKYLFWVHLFPLEESRIKSVFSSSQSTPSHCVVELINDKMTWLSNQNHDNYNYFSITSQH
jgi:hypothetical protein